MYLPLRFKSFTIKPARGLYFILLFATVLIGLYQPLQAAATQIVQANGNLICLLKFSLLVALWLLNMRKLAYGLAFVGLLWGHVSASIITDANLIVTSVYLLLISSMVLELGKLFKLDVYYGNKANLDLIGLVTYVGIGFVLI